MCRKYNFITFQFAFDFSSRYGNNEMTHLLCTCAITKCNDGFRQICIIVHLYWIHIRVNTFLRTLYKFLPNIQFFFLQFSYWVVVIINLIQMNFAHRTKITYILNGKKFQQHMRTQTNTFDIRNSINVKALHIFIVSHSAEQIRMDATA